jgi:hypothetical protein
MIKVNEAKANVARFLEEKKAKFDEAVNDYCETIATEKIKEASYNGFTTIPLEVEAKYQSAIGNKLREAGFKASFIGATIIRVDW